MIASESTIEKSHAAVTDEHPMSWVAKLCVAIAMR
jgi:hypothetical protein